ncbi:unnamed protein product [Cunninghamella echinulata]
MSKFVEFKQKAEIAITNIMQSMVENNQARENYSFITTQIDQHITPISGSNGISEFAIVEEKPNWRKNALEFVLRRNLLSIVENIPEEDPERFNKLFNLLDVILISSEKEYVEQIIPLTFIEELLDIHTTLSCERLFEYVEKRKNRLIVGMIPGRGKALVLLRFCNEMLRRLSKETNTVFCGRILMFLANSFPLGERSGVNLRGDFNSETIHYDSDEVVDADETMNDEQKAFYKLFWATRKYFSDPPSIFQGENFADLQKGAQVIFEKFQEITKHEETIAGAKSTETAGFKRKAEVMDTDDDRMAKQILNEINNDYRFPRLLTSRKLLELEIEDVRFRRNVILQFLILFQYLSGFSHDEKEHTRNLLSARGANKQSLIQPTYTVTDEQMTWVKEMETNLTNLLRHMKPHGTLYTEIVMVVLKHERNWIIWKASGCPVFEKPSFDSAVLKDFRVKRMKVLKNPPTPYRYTYGNIEMTSMYAKTKEPLSVIMNSRKKMPTPVTIIENALKVLEKEKSSSVEERFHIANGALFQATRILFRSHASLIPKVYHTKKTFFNAMYKDESTDQDDAMDEDDGESVEKGAIEDKTPTKDTSSASPISEIINEKRVETEIKVLEECRRFLMEDGII